MGTGDDSRLREVVTEVVTGAGYDLEDLAVRSAGRRRVVKVVIDGDDGVTLDAAADVSRAISARLDDAGDADPTGSAPYTLEVTSPGVGRPLTLPRHFRRARTRLVALVTTDGKELTGHVLGADDESVTLVLSDRRGVTQRQFPIGDISRARVEVEFSAPSAAVLDLLGVRPPVTPEDDEALDEDPLDDDPLDEEALDTDAANEQNGDADDAEEVQDADGDGAVSRKKAGR